MNSPISILSPYYFHPLNLRRFRKNVGDGIILKAVERRLGAFPEGTVYSMRHAPNASERTALDARRIAVLAGANQLQDDFSPWPGLTPEAHRRSGLVFVPYGIGLGGKEDNSGARFTPEAIEHLEIIHDRVEFSSWRCPRTVAALEAAMPHRAGQFLMTSCPVALDRPLLDGKRFEDRDKVVAVTITDRGEFSSREFPVLEQVAKMYPKSRKLLVLHSDFLWPLSFVGIENLPLESLLGERLRIRRLAVQLGYEIVIPRSHDEALDLYGNVVDLHFGSRLHAHLLMLSRNKKSFLVFVDERMTGMAEGLQFPLCPPQNIGEHLDFDFEITRRRAQEANEVMRSFEGHLNKLRNGSSHTLKAA